MKDGGKQTQTTSSSGTSSSLTNLSGSVKGSSRGTAPDWVTTAIQDALRRVSGVAGADPLSFVAGSNPMLDRAAAGAGALGGGADAVGGAMGRIGGLTGGPETFAAADDQLDYIQHANAPRTEAVRARGFIKDYADPWENDVVGSTLADFDDSAGKTRAQQDLDLAGSGAFGGSGAAITKSMTEDALARARASTVAGLRSQGFRTALDAAQADAGRRQSANDVDAGLYAGQMDRAGRMALERAGLATASDANSRANAGAVAELARIFGGEQRADLGLQTDIGQIMRQIEAEGRAAPLNLAAFGVNNIPDMLRGFFGQDTQEDRTGTTSTTGSQTSTGTGTTKDTKGSGEVIGDIAAIASLFLSDRRLKRDVRLLGRRGDGLGLYLFRYLWDDMVHIGVMAQEVLKVRPWAVVTLPGGHMAVDYGRL